MSDPTNTAASIPAAGEEGEAVNWEDVNDGIAPGADDDFEPSALPPEGGEPAAVEPGVVPQATPAVVTPAVAAVAPAAAPPAPVAEAPKPAGPQTTPAPTPEQIAAARQEFTTKLSTGLEETFKSQLTEDDARELVVNPEKILPKLMARASLTGMEMAMHFIQQQLPQFVKQQTAETMTGKELENQFYGANPDLKGHNAVVNKMVSVAKATLEDGASQDDILKEAAALARRKLKLAEPVAPAAPNPAPAKPRAFAPARAAGTAPVAPAAGAKKDNIWAELADDED